jgi:hypothetical protein
MHCGICRVLWSELQEKLRLNDTSALSPGARRDSLSITACLSILDHPSTSDDLELYRLDFKLRYDNIRGARTFVLRKTSKRHPYTLPKSSLTTALVKLPKTHLSELHSQTPPRAMRFCSWSDNGSRAANAQPRPPRGTRAACSI